MLHHTTSPLEEAKLEHVERKQKAHGVKAQELAKGVAYIGFAYIGLRLGLGALRLIGRTLRGKRREAGPGPRAHAQHSAVGATGSAPHAAAGAPAGEDSWSVVDAAPPATPDGYKPIVEAVLPCTPQELYGILFSSSGTDLYLQQHRECGKHWELVTTPWRRAAAAAAPSGGASSSLGPSGSAGAGDGSLLGPLSVFEYVAGQPGSGGFTRLLTFWNPKRPPNSNDTRCVQRQQLCAYRGGVLLFATAMNMLDIPFRDCFTVNTFWRVSPGAAPGTCSVSINLRVQFLKRAMGVGSIISATTARETTAFFSAFTTNVERHVSAMRQQAGAPLPLPLPLPAGSARGAGAAAGVSRSALQSPFAAVAGSPLGAHPGAVPSGAGGATPLRRTLPLWKQLRALLVFALLLALLLHQLHLSTQIAELRAAAAPEAAAAAARDSLTARVAALLAAALEPVAAAAGGVHAGLLALLERVGGGRAGLSDGAPLAGGAAVAAAAGAE